MKQLTQQEIVNFVNSLELTDQIREYQFYFHNKIVSIDFNVLIRAIIDIGYKYPNRPQEYMVIDSEIPSTTVLSALDEYTHIKTKIVRNEYIRKSIRFNDCYFKQTEPERLVASNIEHNYSMLGGVQSYVTEYTKLQSYSKLVLNIELLKSRLVNFLGEVQPIIFEQQNNLDI